jgi:cell division protein ZapE
MSIQDAYNVRLEDGWLEDEAQQDAVAALSALLKQLETPGARPKGIYMYGPVGRGKSQLMDLFMEQVAHPSTDSGQALPSRRTHFHEFMREMHKRSYEIKGGDTVMQITRDLAADVRVLGFDEFYITNIADAMLLGRLFEHMFKQGIVIVATSNWPIDDLFQNGRNRKGFLPFLRLLKNNLTAVDLGDGQDYRRPEAPDWPLYLLESPDTPSRLQDFFEEYAAVGLALPNEFGSHARGRTAAKAYRGRTGWYRFEDICDRALGRNEYLDLLRETDTLIIEGVPRFASGEADTALRLVTLIDICYELKRRVIVSGAAYPDELYSDGPAASAFRRVASRLAEMQTWGESPVAAS